MRVHLIKRQTIEMFVAKNARGRSSFQNWLTVVRFADWNKPEDIRKTFGAADLLGNGSDRVTFNLGGNAYRIICKYVFGEKQVHLFVCWIGTHAEYDKLCADNQQYLISNF
ncbi:MAG: type II toxin-antitoxin system HigB family toxin [Prolixibacteraceae bacterium]|nr:type II toxin-antitoxin system HigB family toxin [Prolixibacteraceae bacterium]